MKTNITTGGDIHTVKTVESAEPGQVGPLRQVGDTDVIFTAKREDSMGTVF